MRIKNESALETTANESPTRGSPGADAIEEQKSSQAKGGGTNVYGKINNLVTNDLQTFLRLNHSFTGFATAPLEMILYSVILYNILGWR
jgi:hypothetical protein